MDAMEKKKTPLSLFKRRENDTALTEKDKDKANSIVTTLTERVSDNYSLEEVEEAEKKAEKYKKKKELSAIWPKIQILFFIARHPKVWGPGVAVPAAVAVLYLVLPIDAIPDVLPGLGLLDDIFVITTLITILIKKISSYTRRELSVIREKVPENLLPTFDEMFPLPVETEEEEKSVEDTMLDTMGDATDKIVTSVTKARDTLSSIHSTMEQKAEKHPIIKKTKFYKAVEKANTFASALPSAVEKIVAEVVKAALSSFILKKEIKTLLSFSLFGLSLLCLYLSYSTNLVLLTLSSMFMVLSYSFLIVAIVKAVPRITAFVKGYRNGGLEEGVCGFVFKETKDNPGMKEILLKYGMREIMKNKEAMKEILLSFRKELILFILKILGITLFFFLLRKIALLSMGESSWRIIFYPIVRTFALW